MFPCLANYILPVPGSHDKCLATVLSTDKCCLTTQMIPHLTKCPLSPPASLSPGVSNHLALWGRRCDLTRGGGRHQDVELEGEGLGLGQGAGGGGACCHMEQVPGVERGFRWYCHLWYSYVINEYKTASIMRLKFMVKEQACQAYVLQCQSVSLRVKTSKSWAPQNEENERRQECSYRQFKC